MFACLHLDRAESRWFIVFNGVILVFGVNKKILLETCLWMRINLCRFRFRMVLVMSTDVGMLVWRRRQRGGSCPNNQMKMYMAP